MKTERACPARDGRVMIFRIARIRAPIRVLSSRADCPSARMAPLLKLCLEIAAQAVRRKIPLALIFLAVGLHVLMGQFLKQSPVIAVHHVLRMLALLSSVVGLCVPMVQFLKLSLVIAVHHVLRMLALILSAVGLCALMVQFLKPNLEIAAHHVLRMLALILSVVGLCALMVQFLKPSLVIAAHLAPFKQGLLVLI